MRLFCVFAALVLLAGPVAAQAPVADADIDARKLAWLERVNLLLTKIQSDALALKPAAESGDQAKICTAIRPMVENQKAMRDLQVEYAQIDPESAKVRGFADKQAAMDAQIVEMEAQLKAKCG